MGTILDPHIIKIDNKMKKIVLFIAFIMSGLFVQAQEINLENLQAKEMDALTKIVTYEHENLTFNKNQTAKLERLFFKKAKEILALRNKEINGEIQKGDYAVGYYKIQDKYRPLVEEILTPAQKIEFRKNEKKQLEKKARG